MEWRLFADLAERADTRRVAVDPGPDPSVRDALDALLEVHPPLRERILEGEEVASDLTILHEGTPVDGDLRTAVAADDELAIIPPVSGG